MKKSIVALAILSAVSFSASATDSIPTQPSQPDYSTEVKVDAFNKAMEKAGNTAMISTTVDAVTGDKTYHLIKVGELPLELVNETAVKNAMKVVALQNTDGYEKVLQEIHDRQQLILDPIDVVIDPVDPGFGIDPQPNNPAPHPGYSNDVKASAFNKAMERNDSNVKISKTVDAVTGKSTYHLIQEGSAPIELTPENEETFKKAVVKAIADNREHGVNPIKNPIVIDPIDVVIDPIKAPIVIDPIDVVIDPISPPVVIDPILKERATVYLTEFVKKIQHSGTAEQKTTAFNRAMELSGKDVKIIGTPSIDADGNNTFMISVDGAEPVEMSQELFTEIAGKKQAENTENRKEQQFIDPITNEPIVEPVEPREPTRDGEVAKAAKEQLELSGTNLTTYMTRSYAEQVSIDSTQDQRISENSADIDTLFSEVERIDSKMDSVMASTHAINNARPFLTASGKTAIGVGMGYAGSEGAVAIGMAHSINENWSTSLTINATTGSYSEVSGGAGIQYQF